MVVPKAVILFICISLVWSYTEVRVLSAAEAGNDVDAVAFSNDNQNVIFASGNNIQIWELTGFTLVRTIEVGEKVNKILASSSTDDIVVSTTGGRLINYNLTTGAEIRSANYPGAGNALDMAFIDSESQIVVVGQNENNPFAYTLDRNFNQRTNVEVVTSQTGTSLEQVAVSPDDASFAISSAANIQ